MSTMRAVVYDKPFSVSIQKVQKPSILHPDDIIVKGERLSANRELDLYVLTHLFIVTTTCICGRYYFAIVELVTLLTWSPVICTCMKAAQLQNLESSLGMRSRLYTVLKHRY